MVRNGQETDGQLLYIGGWMGEQSDAGIGGGLKWQAIHAKRIILKNSLMKISKHLKGHSGPPMSDVTFLLKGQARSEA